MSTDNNVVNEDEIRAKVREHYGRFAAEFEPNTGASCCGPTDDSCGPAGLASSIYETTDVTELPEEITGLSAGCGDPVTLASLEPGQTVLDLGSGGGIDCFLAAKRVGETGKVIGVDMTTEMIDKARANKEKIGAANVEFRLGEIEHLPAPDESVDIIISNCVINLSPDKPQVFRDVYRVLKPGGRIAVTDIVTDGPLPDAIQESLSAWYGCIAGALDVVDYISGLEEAGFVDVQVTPVEMDRATVEAALEAFGIEVSNQEAGEASRKAFALVDGEMKAIDLSDSKPPFSARITACKPR